MDDKQDARVFECVYCDALVRSRIVPNKCEKCGHESFLIHALPLKDSNEDIVNYYKNKKDK
jgi:uncharacterized OB-fold protein